MNVQPSPEALARYLAGESSPDESAAVLQWLESSESARLELEGSAVSRRPDVTLALDRIENQRIRIQGSTSGRRPAARVHTLWTRPVRAAAAIAAIALVGALLLWSAAQDSGPAEEHLLTYETSRGERLRLRLADGTQVELNVESRLQVSPTFGSKNRGVKLEGEAFFDVTPNRSLPFEIDVPDASVRVVGTSFSVDAYPDGESVSVVVAEGIVEFEPMTDSTQVATLTTGDYGMLDRRPGSAATITVSTGDVSTLTGWRRGELHFVGSTLEVVAAELARWYDVDVSLADYRMSALRLDATYTNEPLVGVLESISRALKISYTLDDAGVIFKPSA